MLQTSRKLYLATLRSFHTYHTKAPLAECHREFLDLVRSHGGGNIHMNHRGSYIELIIDNAKKRNSITGKMMNQFAEIVDKLVPAYSTSGAENSVVGVILTGSGKDAFCSGADLTLAREVLNTPAKGGLMSAFMTDALNRLRQSDLISICSLNGPALGGGSEIVTACDFRIMPSDENNYIQFIHAKIGACPGWGGARRLTSIVGRNQALLACAGSLKLTPQKALDMHLVDALYCIFHRRLARGACYQPGCGVPGTFSSTEISWFSARHKTLHCGCGISGYPAIYGARG